MKRTLYLFAALTVMCAQLPVAAEQSTIAFTPTMRHLVYRFGYNTRASDSGQGTGTTTIDIVGPGKHGGLLVKATDFWWNTPRPRQTHACEVQANGDVDCTGGEAQALSPIQAVIVPLVASNYFASLGSGGTSSWKQNYKVTATFAPAAHSGFAGKVTTWNVAYSLEGKGTVPNDAPIVLVHAEGRLEQQGGRHVKAQAKGKIAYDPRIHVPAMVSQEFIFVPRQTTDRYTVELRLQKHGTSPSST